MTSEFRHKLLRWLVSMGVLILITNLSLIAYWFFNELNLQQRPLGNYRPPVRDIVNYAGPIGEVLMIFVFGFLPCAWWHGFDFVTRHRPGMAKPHPLLRYPVFLCGLTLLGLSFISMVSGHFMYTECLRTAEGEIAFGFDTCQAYHRAWVWVLLWSGLLLLAVSCIGKAHAAMRSRFQRPE